MAGDPMAALLLVGLGYDSLSMNARSLLKVKKVIRSFAKTEAEAITQEALRFPRANDVYNLLFQKFEQRQLGGLIRAGR